MGIGRNIAMIRKRRGMTQKDLALKVEITREYLASIETEKERVSIRVQARIASVLGVPVTELRKGE